MYRKIITNESIEKFGENDPFTSQLINLISSDKVLKIQALNVIAATFIKKNIKEKAALILSHTFITHTKLAEDFLKEYNRRIEEFKIHYRQEEFSTDRLKEEVREFDKFENYIFHDYLYHCLMPAIKLAVQYPQLKKQYLKLLDNLLNDFKKIPMKKKQTVFLKLVCLKKLDWKILNVLGMKEMILMIL